MIRPVGGSCRIFLFDGRQQFDTCRRHLSRFMYRVNKSPPHGRPLLSGVAAARSGLISIRDLDCPADRVSWQSDLLFQRTPHASAELSARATIPGTLLSSFFIQRASTLPADARPLPFSRGLWQITRWQRTVTTSISRRVKLSGSRHGTDR